MYKYKEALCYLGKYAMDDLRHASIKLCEGDRKAACIQLRCAVCDYKISVNKLYDNCKLSYKNLLQMFDNNDSFSFMSDELCDTFLQLPMTSSIEEITEALVTVTLCVMQLSAYLIPKVTEEANNT